MFRLSVPEVIRFNRSNYNDDLVIETEEDVGPEIMHIYQVSIPTFLDICPQMRMGYSL